MIPDTAMDGLRVLAFSSCNTMEVRKKRIDDRYISASCQLDAADGIVVDGAMEPDSVIYDLSGNGALSRCCQRVHEPYTRSPRQFQADQAIMIRSRGEDDRAACASPVHDQFGQNISCGTAV